MEVHSRSTLDAVIARAVEFLRAAQLPHGEFKTLVGSDTEMSNATSDSSPFVTCFVVYALGHVSRADAKRMIQAALHFLDNEKEIGGVWRYYGRRQYKHCRVPPDLDDTACASYALQSNGWRAPKNRWIFRANRDSAGRFLTWIAPSMSSPVLRLVRSVGDMQAERSRRLAPRPAVASHPRLLTSDVDQVPAGDIDPVVNANIILYLGENPETKRAAVWLVSEIRAKRPAFSLYYKDRFALYYMVARAYRHGAPTLASARDAILQGISDGYEAKGGFGSALSAALAACTLLTYDHKSALLNEAITALLREQQPDGSWPVYPFYNGPGEFWGSPDLTTAFCVEALARYSNPDSMASPP